MQYDVSDNELIYLYRCNNFCALEELTQRYKKRIYGLIEKAKIKYGMERMDFDDYYQTCYVAFIKCIDMFDDNYMFYNYIIQSMENVLKREIEKEKKHGSLQSLDTYLINDGYPFIETINDSTHLYESNSLKEFINENFDELSIKIMEYKIRGYNCREISQILNISKKVIYARLNNIKKTLKNESYH